MHDWRKIVEESFGRNRANDAADAEIVTEVAGYAEDLYDHFRNQGTEDAEAARLVLKELTDGEKLRRRLRSAKEGDMNDRTKQFWLPGMASLIAASVFLMVFARVSYLPHMLVVRSGMALMMYPAWLVAQPLFGGVGAYFSRRAGGPRRTRILAALSPSIALLSLACIGGIVQIVMAAFGKRTDIGSMGTAMFARSMYFALVIPSVALLAGALPFLRDKPKEA